MNAWITVMEMDFVMKEDVFVIQNIEVTIVRYLKICFLLKS